jgi:tetratricopeptide (TPR) repeat protein
MPCASGERVSPESSRDTSKAMGMNLPNWSEFTLESGILREPASDGSRIVVWMPGAREGTFQYWERIGSVARAEVTADQGLCATAAISIPARQRLKGFLGQFLGRLREAKGSRGFVLPNGAAAEQCGERASDLMLVWAQDESAPLDEARLRARWPEGRRFRKLGPNLFLVDGLSAPKAGGESAPDPPLPAPDISPRRHAEELLAAARRGGDRTREAAAMTDLGIILLSEGDPRGAIAVFEQALALNQQLGDRAWESDILGNLGLALLHIQQPLRARQHFEHELAYARSTGDRFAEKVALERLGLAEASLGDPARALASFEHALAMARELGDRQQEANLLWLQGIQLAELNQREPAIAKAQEAVALFGKLGKPQAGWYGAYLQKYRMGLSETWPALSAPGPGAGAHSGPQAYLGGSLVASAVASQSGPAQSATGPGLLRMALSATKAMAQFAGSGFKTSPPEVQRQRLKVCSTCEHHTGLRCKICGCFTGAKSRMLHEACPIGKWPA